MTREQQKAMFAQKGKLTSQQWKQILASNKSISNDQRLHDKFFEKIDRPSGFAFSDLDHLNLIKERLDLKLIKLAKMNNYKQEGFTKYQAWLDHSPSKVS